MKPQDIKVGHIYYVQFNPVKKGEFADKHLAIVIKKNADKITFLTIPLTSQEIGLGINKVELGNLICLPKNLQNKASYAVLDQPRTVNADRFTHLFEEGKPYEVELPEELFIKVLRGVIKDLLHDTSIENQNAILVDILHSNMKIID